MEYEGFLDVPTCVPLRNILYPVTPTLSVEADHERLIWLADGAMAERPEGTDGAVVSVDTARVVAVTLALWFELFPAASYADTV